MQYIEWIYYACLLILVEMKRNTGKRQLSMCVCPIMYDVCGLAVEGKAHPAYATYDHISRSLDSHYTYSNICY